LPSGCRSGSRSTARAIEPANLIAVPDGRRQGSEGLIVEASVIARVFRSHLLGIEASVVISPAHVTARSPAVAPRTRSQTIGAGLAAAVRVLDEGAASLEASRRE